MDCCTQPAFSLYAARWKIRRGKPDATEAAAILKAVCGAGAQVKDSPQGTQMYCSPCPDFTSLHGLTTENFQLRLVLAGNFSAPASQDLAAFFEGCELLSENFGGAVLLEQSRRRLEDGALRFGVTCRSRSAPSG